MLTRSSENSNSRKSSTSDELEDGPDIDDV